MKRSLQYGAFAAAAAIAAANPAAAAPPKEGAYDFTACWSGVSHTIVFSKTYSAFSYEMTGTARSNPPGGMFDQTSFRCVGVSNMFDGKAGGTAICELIDKDGHKSLSYFATQDGKSVREQISGTGKYEGMVRTTTVQSLGQFPVVKEGTFQNCNRQTGTYKLK